MKTSVRILTDTSSAKSTTGRRGLGTYEAQTVACVGSSRLATSTASDGGRVTSDEKDIANMDDKFVCVVFPSMLRESVRQFRKGSDEREANAQSGSCRHVMKSHGLRTF